MLVADGGVGKTQALAQLAFSVATGAPWLNTFAVTKPGRVLWAFAEDDVDELRRRVFATLKHVARDDPRRHRSCADALEGAITLISTSGEEARFLSPKADAPTGFFHDFEHTVQELAPALVIIDPGSRFMGHDENDNAAANRWVALVERLTRAKEGHAAPVVMLAMHTHKGADLEKQGAVRGASAVTQGARWVATLGVEKDEESMRLRRVKVNGCPHDGGPFDVERAGRVLVASPAPKKTSRSTKNTDWDNP